jgi:hypothetical protein
VAEAAKSTPHVLIERGFPGFETVPGVKLFNVRFCRNGIGLSGQNGIPKGLVQNHWDTFAPRLRQGVWSRFTKRRSSKLFSTVQEFFRIGKDWPKQGCTPIYPQGTFPD